LRYPKKRSTNRATQPKSLVNVVSKTSSRESPSHGTTDPYPCRSQGHPHRHLPLSLRRNLSAFSVVLVSETPNQMGCLVYASTATHTYSGWPPTLHHRLVNSDEYSRGFGLKLSFSSTFLIHPSTLDFETGSESRPKKLEVFLRLNPKAFRSTAITLSSEEPLLVPHENI